MSGFLQTGSKADCTACGACAQCCPRGAVSLKEDQYGFVFPEIDPVRCIHCGLCRKVCPVDNSNVLFHPSGSGRAVAGFAKDETIRAASSSGGFFTGVVRAFWKDGETVVFGAELQPDLTVAHTRADTLDDIAKFRKSKYARSDTRNTFAETRVLLAEGKRILYSGTPCQIAGLLSFLGGGAEPENLLTVDIVCHGYFSPLFLRKERAFLERKHGSKAVDYEFRNKDGGHWKDFKAVWRFQNGDCVEMPRAMLPYHAVWSRHLISRDSCHACRFARADRVSDITLADFWHVKEDSPLFGANGGTSLVLANTGKGQRILASLKDSYFLEPVDRDWIAPLKYGLHAAKGPHPHRSEALADLTRLSYTRFCRKWMTSHRPSALRRLTNKVAGAVRKILRSMVRTPHSLTRGSHG